MARIAFPLPCVLALLAAAVWTLACASSMARAGDSPPARPNVLIIIADDLGYADIGSYGSEISTPNIDRLARSGVQFTNFHVAATCSPTRAMLLTGVDNHLNGLGSMGTFLADNQRGQPGYEGHLNRHALTLAEILGDTGYDTYFSGKWHLGPAAGQWPIDRGFRRSYAMLGGSADNYSDLGPAPVLPRVDFVAGRHRVERGNEHSSTLFVDQLLSFVDADRAAGRPFLAILSFQAVHWPHHAPSEFIEKYARAYDAGWDVTRAARIERQKALGLIPRDLPLSPRSARVEAWQDLSLERKTREARRMAAYAGMTDHMDHEIGRVLSHLRKIAAFDDTLIVFLSDNGPDPSEPDRNPRASAWYARHYPDNSLEALGGPGSFPSYGSQWAQLGAGHLRDFKGSASEGGLRVPLVISHPARIAAGGRSDAFVHVTDIVPTILQATQSRHPGSPYRGLEVHPLHGNGLMPLLLGETAVAHSESEAIAYELMKNRALYRGKHKLVRNGPPSGEGAWELFDIVADPSEQEDLSTRHQDLRDRMIDLYETYAAEVGVIPMPDDYDVFKVLTTERQQPGEEK